MVLRPDAPSVVGLFAGIGGVEVGLARAGFHARLLCEIDKSASEVLRTRFAGTPLHEDVRTLRTIPRADVLAAGFPCQDLSQAGRTAGIGGRNSGLVGEVFRLLERTRPRWLVLENVSFMLALDRGRAMRHLTSELGRLGYAWAYRVVDTRSFGLPQRRQRVILAASRTEAPWDVLLADDAPRSDLRDKAQRGRACGFYWTEGVRGLGWAVDAVPTLKGGSTIGIPSPPAIWMPDGRIGTPDIRDAERLQGFESDWTLPAAAVSKRRGTRWKLVGNAVSTPVFEWVGRRLVNPGSYDGRRDARIDGGAWPHAAWGRGATAHVAERSKWPLDRRPPPLAGFLEYALTPLSARATAGFLDRTRTSTLRFPEGFLDAVARHLERMECRLWASARG